MRDLSQDIVAVRAEIRTERLSNTNVCHYIYTNLSGMKTYEGAGA
jgi:hypothetical protein